ncbi:MAG: DUF4339 domain-containing protein [Deltaproteobacteria bacterium]|nr:DUF4339 domain-containing protein [Deltaproteobacteria bacterium]
MSSGAWDTLPSFDKPASGAWLYQHAGNLYGPVSTEILLERIRTGALNEDTVVCEDGHDDFVPLLQHPTLKAAVEKALEQAEAHRQKQAVQKKKQQRTTVVVGVLALVVAAGVGGSVYGYRAWQGHQIELAQKKQQAEDAAKRKRDEDLRKAEAELAAKNSEIEVDLELLPLVSVSSNKKKVKGKKGHEVEEGPQGCQLDQGSMVTTLRGAFPQIKGCIRDQSSKGAAMPEALTLSFTIANTGSVASFETDDRNVRTGPFFDCLKRAVTGLHFQKFAGERCNIDYPITIGKRH